MARQADAEIKENEITMTMDDSVIVSRFGNRVIHWNAATLEKLLVELRTERLAHDISVATERGEAEHNALISKAEQMEAEATNHIHEALSSA